MEMNNFRRLIVPCMVFAPLATAFAEDNTHLPGHRAVYELSLGDTRGSVAIRGAEGRYVFDLEDICDGYTLNERLVVRLARDGGTVLTDYRLSAFETENGDLYRFSTETEFNGTTEQSASGNLSVEKESAAVDYDSADDITFDETVMPPLAHMRAILDAARAGEDRYAATVFDGDVQKPVFYAVTRINDAGEKGDLSSIEGGEALEDVKRWRIDSVYFPPSGDADAATATPEFRFTATLFDNGVVTDLTLDYLDFSLEAELVDLKVNNGGC